jgi:hypothetical protein
MLFLIKQLYIPKDLIEYILNFTIYNQKFYKSHKFRLYRCLASYRYELNKELQCTYWNPRNVNKWIYQIEE